MRQRRAERCMLRAEEALAAGFEDAAREALDEVRRLRPSDTPDFEALRARIAARTVTPDVLPAVVQTRRPLWPVAAVLLTVAATLIAIAGYSLRSDPATVQGVPAPASAHVEPPVAPSPAAPAATIAHETVRAVPDAASEVVSPAAQGGVGPLRVSLTAEPAAVPTTGTEASPALLATTPSVTPAPPSTPPLEIPRAAAGAPIESLPAALPPPAAAPSVPLTAPAAAPAPAPDAAEPRIRAVLSAYESAFGSLDASAAREVWPSVDERALSRAFDGLASQSISLGGCAITVQSVSAIARCTGSATWVPKVGGGERTEPRRWEFALEQSGGTWQIVRANVR